MTGTLAPSSPRTGFDLPTRLKAAGIHLGLSALVAVLVALLVLGVWYPQPFRDISGGRELFTLIVAVDVAVGPLITFAVFDRRKPRAELRRDLAVVALLQLAALGYGVHSTFEARPVVLALEAGERLRVVRAIDIAPGDLAKAPAGLRELPWTGRLTVATRQASAAERLDAVQLALAGVDLGMRPDFWLPPEATANALRRSARPLAELLERHPAKAALLARSVAATGRAEAQLGFLPLLALRSDWVALIDRESGEVVGNAPIDGF